MLDTILTFLAPNPCFGCGKIGQPLCDNCKYNIISEQYSGCLACGRVCGPRGVCGACCTSYERAWCVGERVAVLHDLIDAYKFQRLRTAHQDLARLLADSLPDLPSETIIVPVPTINTHIRQRGYDHTLLLAGHLARLKACRMQSLLHRTTQSVQRGAPRRNRIRQAKEAFTSDKIADTRVPYLVLDDIVTTGATLHYAAKALKDAGAREVWVAALARQVSTK